ncbi:hypothetical protein LSH36_2526g00000 [Paralvinella palmiformis]|uniref:Uncharacterized protein n=1 Tax=Paralvinella palmiformis TaxID=53620 RepID=A0AAD9IR52_9ANNE|nr:hypothetical protein LSH36_2526g00000 [Paralvinella palmiformis]
MDILNLSFVSLKVGLLMATSFWMAASFFDRDLSFIVNDSFTFLKFCLLLFRLFLFLPIVKAIPSGYLPSLFIVFLSSVWCVLAGTELFLCLKLNIFICISIKNKLMFYITHAI